MSSPYNVNTLGNEGGAREYLDKCEFPTSLQDFFFESLKDVPIRYIVCDDSGSMNELDGSVYDFAKKSNDTVSTYGFSSAPSIKSCSRWTELKNALDFHINLSYYGQIATNIRFLNRGTNYRIGFPDTTRTDSEVSETVKDLFKRDPSGGTPLCMKIQEIALEISQIAPFLKQNNQKVALVIYTDGEPSDGNFKDTLSILKNLPVHVVIRLCTDQDSVQSYWASIEKNVELNLDIIDDYKNEASEVCSVNPFLNYCYPIHKIREYGVTSRMFDHLDEGPLSNDQIRQYISLFLTKEEFEKLPDSVDMNKLILAAIPYVDKYKFYDPLKKRITPFLNIKLLKKKYNSGCILC